MTEQEWKECNRPLALIEFVLNTAMPSQRKLILLSCAIYRSVEREPVPSLTDEPLFSIEAASQRELLRCELSTDRCEQEHLVPCLKSHFTGGISVRGVGGMTTYHLIDSVAQAAKNAYRFRGYRIGQAREELIAAVHADVVRHIIGNPFRQYPASWPSTVVELTRSFEAGQDCAFALHDAVLEAGHAELAEHFREEQWHPKGCFAMDAILGKS